MPLGSKTKIKGYFYCIFYLDCQFFVFVKIDFTKFFFALFSFLDQSHSVLHTHTVDILTEFFLPDIGGPNEGILILGIIISFRISLLEVNPLVGCHSGLTINGATSHGAAELL